MELSKFDRFDELVEKVSSDSYLKEYCSSCGGYDAHVIAENMVLLAPEEVVQNLYEYIDGDVFIDKDGLWNFGPFSDIYVDGICLNDILSHYRAQVLFRQKYSKSWLRHFKCFERKLVSIPIRTRVIHPWEALQILTEWRECDCANEIDCALYWTLSRHWKYHFEPVGCNAVCGYSQVRSEERLLRKMSKRIKEQPSIYGKLI